MKDETPQEVIDDIIMNSEFRYAKEVYKRNLRSKLDRELKEENVVVPSVSAVTTHTKKLGVDYDS